jgi:glucokinase
MVVRPASFSAAETLSTLIKLGRELASGSSLEAVGFGFGGTVRRSSQTPAYCFHEPGWQDVNARKQLEDAFGVPVFIENDCNVAALAEAWADSRVEEIVLLYVTVGTGIGAGLVDRGRLLRLGEWGEVEIGHVVVTDEAVKCPCGNSGCLESVCSGPGLSALAGRRLAVSWDAPTLMNRFRRGEQAALSVVQEAAQLMSRALSATVTLLAPDTVVLGGGVMTDNLPYLELLRARTTARVFPQFEPNTIDFRLSSLGEEVVCRGAALFALQQLGRLECP